MKILSDPQEKILSKERDTLTDLSVALAKINAVQEDQDILRDSIKLLDELFLLVVVGEFNSGKSAFINALLGKKYLEEGVTPTTKQINILRHGNELIKEVASEKEHILYLPVEWLSEISIVDTPGTNAVMRNHEEITTRFVPQSDLVIFITSVDRPFTESERKFLESIRNWGKKVIIVINKIDIITNEEELNLIEKYVVDNSDRLLGLSPEIFPVSSKYAFEAKNGDKDKWKASRFEEVEIFVNNTLDETERIKLKLLNPLGVGINLSNKYITNVQSQIQSLQEDLRMISDVETQLTIYKEDMLHDFNFRLADIDNVLLEMENRGDDFFEDTFRLARVIDLLDKQRIQKEFENKVIADVPAMVDKKVNEIIDWIVESNLGQWQGIYEHLNERRKSYEDRIVGFQGFRSFRYERSRLIDSISRNAQSVIDTYDRNKEAKDIAEDAQIAVAASAALEIGAIGLGSLVTILATTAAADITGILLASLVAMLGLIVIPAQRRSAKKELHKKIKELRDQLVSTLETQFEKEINQGIDKITDAMAPYTRFIKSEHKKFDEEVLELGRIHKNLNQIKANIELP